MLLLTCFSSTGASIVFMNPYHTVSESRGVEVVCAQVDSPNGCDIDFPFDISLETSDGSAGITYICH